MAVITSTGPWPQPEQTFPALAVYARPTPRAAIPLAALAARFIDPGTGGTAAAGSTTVPVMPVSTRYPINP